MILSGAISALLVGSTFIIPVIDSGATFGELPYTVVTPLIAIVFAGYVTAAASIPVTAVSARPYRRLFASTTLVGLSVFVATHCIVLASTVGTFDLSGARNLLGYAFIMLVAQPWTGVRIAPMAPVLYVVLATIFGRIGGTIQPWAWPVLSAGAPDVLAAALAALAGGLVATYVRPRR